MSPFFPAYAEQVNIRICNGITAYTLYSMEVVILEFGKGLWFGNRMDKSLINPNQFRRFGIQICDDPNGPHRKLEIEVPEDLFVPMEMKESTCGLITHPPNEDELRECQHIIISYEFYWDP